MAVDYLCHIFEQRSDIQVCLFSLYCHLWQKLQCDPKRFYDKWEKNGVTVIFPEMIAYLMVRNDFFSTQES